jgi:hypothetical protein
VARIHSSGSTRVAAIKNPVGRMLQLSIATPSMNAEDTVAASAKRRPPVNAAATACCSSSRAMMLRMAASPSSASGDPPTPSPAYPAATMTLTDGCTAWTVSSAATPAATRSADEA